MTRSAWLVILLGFGVMTAACRRGSSTTPASPPAAETAAPAAPVASPPSPSGASREEAAQAATAAQDTQTAVKTQSRFERNTRWLNELASGDVARRTRTIAEIRQANLPRPEMIELGESAKLYGIKLE